MQVQVDSHLEKHFRSGRLETSKVKGLKPSTTPKFLISFRFVVEDLSSKVVSLVTVVSKTAGINTCWKWGM